MTTRICRNPECRKPLERRTGEPAYKFRRRVTCGPACGVMAAHEHHRVSARPEHVAHCAICGCRLVRKPHEEQTDFVRRQTCGMNCFKRLISERNRVRVPRIRNTDQRTCQAPGCSEPIIRRPREILGNFERRKTCSDACRNALRCETMRLTPVANRGTESKEQQLRAERSAIAGIEAPTQRQVLAYLSASADERRLFDPGIAAAAARHANRSNPCT